MSVGFPTKYVRLYDRSTKSGLQEETWRQRGVCRRSGGNLDSLSPRTGPGESVDPGPGSGLFCVTNEVCGWDYVLW